MRAAREGPSQKWPKEVAFARPDALGWVPPNTGAKPVQHIPSDRGAASARSIVIPLTLHPIPTPSSGSGWRRLALASAFLGLAALIAWTCLGRWELPSLGGRQTDYYNLLVSGFRKGSLALDIPVPEQFKQAKDTAELMQMAQGRAPHDVSYFNGRYYTYYGVVPAVVLYWPFRVLTGRELPLVLGTLAFAVGALAVMASLWLRILSDNFPRSGLLARVAGIAALCLAGGQLVLARRVSIWEPSIEAGNFFLACMVASGYRALRSRSPWGWLAACGLALGLAAGSRPTLAVAGLGFLALVAAIGRGGIDGRPRMPARTLLRGALPACLPLVVVATGLLAYNWARFGNPLELGLKYQFSTWNQIEKAHFRPAFIPFNAFLYFLAPPQWGRYFPFVHPIAFPRLPAGYYGYEYVYGALVVCPVVLWGALVPALASRAGPPLRAFAVFVLAIAVATTLVILTFDTAAARYETDFLPWWVLLALLGWALLEDRMREGSHRGAARFLAAAFGASAAFSCVVAFCCSAELHEILETSNPGAYRGISRVFDTPTALWERLSGFRGGAVEMNITFAARPLQSVEPLVVTGVEYQRDYVYLYYQRDDVVRFCYVHPGQPVASSVDIAIEPGRTYPLRVECGALYPPEGHPAFAGWLPAEVSSLKQWVRVDFNGHTVLNDSRGSNEASPGTVQVGIDAGNGYCGHRFAGTVADIRRSGWTHPVGDLAHGGDFDIALTLPSAPSRLNIPLLAAGRPGAADIVSLSVAKDGRYELGYESWGLGIWHSALLDPKADRLVSLRVRLGSMLPIAPDSPLGALTRSVVAWENGTPVWWRRTQAPIGANPPFTLFSNALGSTAEDPVFRGRVISASRAPLAPAWRRGPFDALELQLGGRGQGCEPLVATGVAGRSDTLSIEWLGSDRARLAYDHWGHRVLASESFGWQGRAPKEVSVGMPSLAALDTGGDGEGRLRASVDGAEVLDAQVPFFAAASETVAVATNASRCASTAAELSSVVIDIRQVTHDRLVARDTGRQEPLGVPHPGSP
jgi:hypothetical protein